VTTDGQLTWGETCLLTFMYLLHCIIKQDLSLTEYSNECKYYPTCAFFLAGIGFSVLLVAYVRVAVWLVTSYRQTLRIRLALLQAVLRQEIGWFDTHDAGEIGNRLAESVLTLF